jgi:hypothetical protein
LINKIPEEIGLDPSKYDVFIVQAQLTEDNYNNLKRFHKKLFLGFSEPFLMDLFSVEDMVCYINNQNKSPNKTVDNTQILPCCKCGSMDKWNSLGKDNKYYCYQHCSY